MDEATWMEEVARQVWEQLLLEEEFMLKNKTNEICHENNINK